MGMAPPQPLPTDAIFFVFGPDADSAYFGPVAAHEFGHTKSLVHVKADYHDIMQPEIELDLAFGTTNVPLPYGDGTQNDTAILNQTVAGALGENAGLNCSRLGGTETVVGYPIGSDWIAGRNNPEQGPGGIPQLVNYEDYTHLVANVFGNLGYAEVIASLKQYSALGASLLGSTVSANKSFGAIYWKGSFDVVDRSTTLVEVTPPGNSADPNPQTTLVSEGSLVAFRLVGREYFNRKTFAVESLSVGAPGIGTVSWPEIVNIEFSSPSLGVVFQGRTSYVAVDQSPNRSPLTLLDGLKSANGKKVWFEGASEGDGYIVLTAWGPLEN
jgi:hypothetical protein